MQHAVEVTLLGPVLAAKAGSAISLGSPRQRSVFAVLAASANRMVTREAVVNAVWGAQAPDAAVNSVYTYVSRLRKSFEPARSSRGSSSLIISDSVGYMLQIPDEQVDTRRFENLATSARRLAGAGQLREAVTEIEAGLALWQGEPFGGAPGPFAEGERLRLTELRLAAIEDRVGLCYRLGRHDELVGELSALVYEHPLREHLRYLLMLCYARLGRQAEALATYHNLRIVLADELGIGPSRRLQECYEQILRTGHAVEQHEPVRAGQHVPPAADHGAEPPTHLARDVPDFVGRSDELAQLHDIVTAGLSGGTSSLVVLTGLPGAGKSALAVRFAHEVAHRFPDGQLQVDLRGFTTGARPMTSAEVMRHLLGAIGVTSLPEDPEQQVAMYRGLIANRRLLLVLDDAVSAEQVRPLLPAGSSCCVLVTSRYTLAGLTAVDGARSVPVNGLDPDDAVELFHALVGKPFPRSAEVIRLVEACGKLPLALRVAATKISMAPSPERALQEFGKRNPIDMLHVLGDRQSSVREVFQLSCGALGADAARMLLAIGLTALPSFALRTVAGVAGVSPAVARCGLDSLADMNFVHESVQDHFTVNPLVFAYARYLNRGHDCASPHVAWR